ncbi:hypothetical protein M3D75_12670 [Microbacterium enclense]|uniref:hypothetical protein n=1 Tax=Microbacterium enclense TaxID=993073 RepID=UPI0021A6A681|nr:hypothetical protein [Microbacterium enclense]MCT2086972.1 hypothetical protein [Microbacterium enclense]
MGFLDRLFGSSDDARRAPAAPASHVPVSGARDADGRYAPPPPPGAAGAAPTPSSDDAQALDRYRYLLRTAPPETVEQVHAEAFARLTPSQRQQVLQELSSGLPFAERPRSDDPASLARAATRAEYTRPGFMERTFGGRSFGGGGGAPGFGSLLGASMLGTIGGYVIGSALVGSLFDPGYAAGFEDGVAADGGDAASFDDPGAGDAGEFGDFGGDFGF